MPITLENIKKSVVKPPRMLIYGVHGIGKTSLAASFPSPVFLQTEDGLGTLEAPSFGLLKDFSEVMEALGALYTEDHDFKTVVLDSLDWLEPIVWAETARANGWVNIEQAGYGKGYIAASDNWRVLLDGLNALRDEKGLTIVILAHSEVKQFNSPDSDPYDRYIIKLHKAASALVQEHVDCVFFVNYRITTVKTDVGFNKKAVRAVGGGQRVLFTEERPSFLAKNRYSMPESIDLPDDPNGGFSALSPIFLSQEPKVMANIGNFDANSVQPNEAMEVLPPGDYRAHIVNSDMRSTKDGNGQYLWLELAIIDGPYANRRVFDRLNLVNNNPQAVEIAQRTLSAICHAVGKLQVSDSEELHHKPMLVKVNVRPAAGQYSAQNEIKGYKPAPMGAPPAHVAAVTAKPNVPAWKRA